MRREKVSSELFDLKNGPEKLLDIRKKKKIEDKRELGQEVVNQQCLKTANSLITRYGLPIDESGRIHIEVEKQKNPGNLKSRFLERSLKAEILQKAFDYSDDVSCKKDPRARLSIDDGKRAEEMAFIALNRKLKGDTFVVRACLPDDVSKSKLDLLIYSVKKSEKHGTSLMHLFAIKMVCSTNEETVNREKAEAAKANKKGGASVNYFLKMQDGEIFLNESLNSKQIFPVIAWNISHQCVQDVYNNPEKIEEIFAPFLDQLEQRVDKIEGFSREKEHFKKAFSRQ